MRSVDVGNVQIGGRKPLTLIAGPCVAESPQLVEAVADRLVDTCDRLDVGLVFKCSYDKANRTSIDAFRGPGLDEGLRILDNIKSLFGVPVITDIHTVDEADPVSAVADIIQIPAFLCRQTDLISAAGETGLPVNVKKGQFMAPWDMQNVVRKVRASGGADVILTERGTSFGYNNLVVDMRSLAVMRGFGVPVVLDATHSVQLPGGAGNASSGQREYVTHLARAGVAVGIDGLFLEVHSNPDNSLCDGPNVLDLADLPALLSEVKVIDALVKEGIPATAVPLVA